MAKVVLKKVKHIMTIGSDKYSFRAADIYGDFGSQIGVTKAPSPDSTNYAGRLSRQSFRDGTAIKVKARGVVVDSNGAVTESRDFTIDVPGDKVRTALANLDTKSVTINSKKYDLGEPRIPQRRRFS